MPGACIDTRPILHSHRQDTEPSRTASRYHNWRTMLHGPCLCRRRSDLPVWWRSSSGLFQCPQQRGSSIWSKDVMDQTKVRNLGSGLPSSSLTVDGEIVEGVEEFVYLGSKQASDGYCSLEIKWCIGLASAVMSSLRKVWNNGQLCVDTKVHVYSALVQSVLLYGSQIWTLIASDIKKLEAFHLRCKRLLCVSWRDHITNEAICKQTKLTSLAELISRRRTSLFGHITRLDTAVPAHQYNEDFNRTESGYQLEETAWSFQENMDLSYSVWYWNVISHLLWCLHSSWP